MCTIETQNEFLFTIVGTFQKWLHTVNYVIKCCGGRAADWSLVKVPDLFTRDILGNPSLTLGVAVASWLVC